MTKAQIIRLRKQVKARELREMLLPYKWKSLHEAFLAGRRFGKNHTVNAFLEGN